MDRWYIGKGPESDVVLSSRIRLARDCKDYPFPLKMNNQQGAEVVDNVRKALSRVGQAKKNELLFVDMQSLDFIERQSLVEKHLISPELANSKVQCAALISRDEQISVMINEEDHLRIQCFVAGMDLNNAWKLCSNIDDTLEKNISYAFDEKYGYLTSCPTNLGTGIRVSTMLHIPALIMTGYIKNILEACSKIGIAVRGIYGENSDASGNILQVSNQVTLGHSEEETVANVSNIVMQIIEQERMLRKEIYKQGYYSFEDKIYRSYGIFANARIISTDESLKMLSDVRLGVEMGILNNVKTETLNEIMLLLQPATLQKISGRSLSPDERDVKRAEVIRNMLSNISID